MHYFQLEVKEWVANTAHLSLDEEAAYLRLILFYYDSEKPIPHDDLAMVFRKCRIPEQLGKGLMLEFFEMDGNLGAWIHSRCEQEIARYHAKHEQAVLAGKASAQRRLNKHPTTVQPIINHKSIIKNQNNKAVATPEGVSSSVWEDFLKQRKLAKAAVTPTVIARIQVEATKAGWSLEEALAEIVARGWRGFKADWVTEKKVASSPDVVHQTVPTPNSAFDALKKIEADRKKAAPMPDNIREKLNQLKKA